MDDTVTQSVACERWISFQWCKSMDCVGGLGVFVAVFLAGAGLGMVERVGGMEARADGGRDSKRRELANY